MRFIRGLTATGALTAMVLTGAMVSMPAAAAPLPQAATRAAGPAAQGWSIENEKAEGWRRYRRHRDGIDGGDILAGALIIGGIAAIASAASNESRRQRDRDRYEDSRYRDDRRTSASEINSVADQCSYAAEERAGYGARTDRIDTVARDGAGWRVEGSVSSDRGYENFYCGVTDGRIDYIQLVD